MGQSEIFSIRQMIELTGLSEFTIRGWESRYSAFVPHRSNTGRREYSKGDIERALLLRELLKRGYKISTVAKLNTQRLVGLFEQSAESPKSKNVPRKSQVVSQAMELVALQKWSELSQHLNKIKSKNSLELIQGFFLPVLSELSSQVQAGLVSIAQEHVFSSFLKEKIYSALSELENEKKTYKTHKKIRFVLATPEGDFHETGLLLAHLLIRSRGFTSLYLGPHTPARDIAETALRFEATHLLIVSTISKKHGARQDLFGFVGDIRKTVGSHLQVWIAGSQAPQTPLAQEHRLLNVGSFFEFDEHLRNLNERRL